MTVVRLLLVATALLLAACAEVDYRDAGVDGGAVSTPGGAPPADASYRVRQGDTLYSIAWRNGLDYRRLARWNGIPRPYTIYPGQRLRLGPPPGGGTRAAPRPRAASPQAAPGDPAADAAGGGSGPAGERQSASGAPGWQWPVTGPVVRGFESDGTGKRGIAIGGREGQPVEAAAGGRVVYSGNGLRGYGNLVIVKHSERYLTAYGYNRELLVREGERVSAGQAIARMGLGPGRQALLHFELRRDGEPVDPRRFLPGR